MMVIGDFFLPPLANVVLVLLTPFERKSGDNSIAYVVVLIGPTCRPSKILPFLLLMLPTGDLSDMCVAQVAKEWVS